MQVDELRGFERAGGGSKLHVVIGEQFAVARKSTAIDHHVGTTVVKKTAKEIVAFGFVDLATDSKSGRNLVFHFNIGRRDRSSGRCIEQII